MVQSDNKFLDDLAKLASGAAGTLQGVRQEIDGMVRQNVDRMLARFDFVKREEFDAVKAMAAEARAQNEALGKRIAALEKAGKGSAKAAAKPRKTARKPAQKPGKPKAAGAAKGAG